jgi:hypothetical protein
MIKSGIDQDALIKMFSEAGARSGEALRAAVSDAVLKALQGRELTLANIRNVLKSATQAASMGAAQNPMPGVDVEDMLTRAFAGMDAALLQAVEANRKALEQFVGQGVGVQQAQMKAALANLEKMEDTLFATVSKAAESAGAAMKGPWEHVLAAMKMQGTATGAQAHLTVEQLMAQGREAMKAGRATSMKAAQAMMDSYAALVSGVLIGMSEGLKQGSGAPKTRK